MDDANIECISPGKNIEIPALSSEASPRELGRWGEELGALYMRSAGFEILARNWRAPSHAGELDLVCLEGQARRLVGVEVKTRRGNNQVPALEAVTPQKRNRLHALVYEWLLDNPGSYSEVGVDLLAVELVVGEGVEIYHVRSI